MVPERVRQAFPTAGVASPSERRLTLETLVTAALTGVAWERIRRRPARRIAA
jgi:hypothetical protein